MLRAQGTAAGTGHGSVRSPSPEPMAQPPPPLSPWPGRGRAAFPIAATASGHCRRGLPAASVIQRLLAARWLLPCSGERGRPPQALFPQPPHSGPRGLRGGAASPTTPPLFVLFLALRCFGWVCFGFVFFFPVLFVFFFSFKFFLN